MPNKTREKSIRKRNKSLRTRKASPEERRRLSRKSIIYSRRGKTKAIWPSFRRKCVASTNA